MRRITCRRTTALLVGLVAVAGSPIAAGPANAGDAGTWSESAPIPVGRYTHTQTRLVNGDVLVTGGSTASVNTFVGVTNTERALDTAAIYRAGTGTWTNAAPMAEPRSLHTATLLDPLSCRTAPPPPGYPCGNVLIAGGVTAVDAETAGVEVYEPDRAGGIFRRATELMKVSRAYHTATLLLDGKVLVAGGTTITTGNDATASAELYDPKTGQWTLLPPMSSPRTMHTATLLNDGSVLIAGGSRARCKACFGGTPMDSAEIYTPGASGSPGGWSSTNGPMTQPRAGHTAVRLHDGRVLLVGDVSGTQVTEIYAPSAGTFIRTGDLKHPRSTYNGGSDGNYKYTRGVGITATLLSAPGCGLLCDKVLVTGGAPALAGRTTGTTELFDPLASDGTVTGTWSYTGDMSTLRGGGHGATLLGDGRILVVGGHGSGGSGTLASAEVYLPVAGSLATPALSVADPTAVQEGTPSVKFTVSLSPPTNQPVKVDYTTTGDGTATAGSDYVTTVGTLIFPAGFTSQSVTVPLITDNNYEQDETVVLRLSNQVNSAISRAIATATITNDDLFPVGTVSILDAEPKNEGDTAPQGHVLRVLLSAPNFDKTVTVDYTTSILSFGSPDHLPNAGTLVFTPGVIERAVTVYVAADGFPEPNETFQVTLSRPTNTVIVDGTGFGTILNDDPLPSITIDDPMVFESANGTTASFEVSLSMATKVPVTVLYRTVDLTARGWRPHESRPTPAASDDYVHTASGGTVSGFNVAPNTLVLSPGVQRVRLSVPVLGDSVVEPDETFMVELWNPENAAIAKTSGTATIKNDD